MPGVPDLPCMVNVLPEPVCAAVCGGVGGRVRASSVEWKSQFRRFHSQKENKKPSKNNRLKIIFRYANIMKPVEQSFDQENLNTDLTVTKDGRGIAINHILNEANHQLVKDFLMPRVFAKHMIERERLVSIAGA